MSDMYGKRKASLHSSMWSYIHVHYMLQKHVQRQEKWTRVSLLQNSNRVY